MLNVNSSPETLAVIRGFTLTHGILDLAKSIPCIAYGIYNVRYTMATHGLFFVKVCHTYYIQILPKAPGLYYKFININPFSFPSHVMFF